MNGLSKRRWLVAAAAVGLAAIATLVGFGAYRFQLNHARGAAHAELLAESSLNARLLGAWLAERRKEGQLVQSVPRFALDVEEIRNNGRNPGETPIYRFLDRTVSLFGHYHHASVTDPAGAELFSVGEPTHRPAPSPATIRDALARDEILLTDLYFESDDQAEGASFDIIAPLRSAPAEPPTGAVVVMVDAQSVLHAALNVARLPYESGEVNLLRRNGNTVQHFTKRGAREHGGHGDVTLEQRELVSVMALRSPGQLLEGLDYRGNRVLALGSSVEGSDWLFIAKVDASEVEQSARHAAALAVAAFLLLAAAGGGVAALQWKYRRRDYEQRLRLEKAERTALERHVDYATRFARDIVLLFDEDQRVLEGNDAALQTYGYARDELKRLPVSTLRAPQARAALAEDMARAREAGGATFETVHQRKDGSTFPVEIAMRFLRTDGIGYWHSVIRDITDRKAQERALRESETRFRELTELSADWLWELDAEGRFSYLSPRFYEISGLRPEEVLGRRSWEEDAVAASTDSVAQQAARIAARQPFKDFEFGRPKADGQIMWIAANGKPTYDVDGKFTGYRGTSRDITARVNAEAALREQEKQLEDLLGRIDEVVYSAGIAPGEPMTGPVHFVSSRVRETLGYDPAEFIRDRKFWRGKIHPEDLERIQGQSQKMFVGGKPFTREYRARRSDGAWAWLEDRVTPKLDAGGRVTGVAGVARDVTARKASEANIRHLTRLYAMLSHTNKAIVRSRSETQLFRQLCDDTVTHGGLLGCIARLADPESKELRAVAWSESVREIANAVRVSYDPGSPDYGELPSRVYLTNRVLVRDHLEVTESDTPIRRAAFAAGVRAVAIVPIRRAGQPVGILTLNAAEAGFFDPDTLSLLDEMTADIAFAMDGFEFERRRARTEADLQRSEARYKALFDGMLHGCAYCRMIHAEGAPVDFEYIAGNPAFHRLTGLANVEGRRATEIIPGIRESNPELFEHFDRVATTGEPARFETHVAALGAWFAVALYRLEENHVVAIFDRIDERKAAERRINHLTRLYATLSRVNEAIVRARSETELYDAICRIAVEHGGMLGSALRIADAASGRLRLAAASESMKALAGSIEASYDESSPDHKPLIASAFLQNRIVIENDFASHADSAAWTRAAYEAGIRAIAMLPIRRGDEPIGVLALNSSDAGFFDRETCALLEEMTVDIAFTLDNFAYERRRKEAEARLQESEERFRGLVEQSIAGIYVIEGDKFTYVNPRFAEVCGYTQDELIGQPYLEIVAEESRALVAENMRRRREGEVRSLQYNFTGLRKDGSTFTAGVHGSAASIEGRPAIIGLAQDISEREQAQLRIDNYVRELESTMLGTVQAISAMVEMRDPYTAGHERRVAELARAIGVELSLDENALRGLEVAGTVHDIGKISIPAEILVKPTRLTELEFAIIKTHSQLGHDILKSVNFPWPIAQAILQHHERVDGSGYPQGLKGEDIVLEARILAVADTVEAMASHRPYRPTRGIDEALQEIEKFRGIRYDAQAADACLRLFREKGYRLPPH